jgi:hypothetical protein
MAAKQPSQKPFEVTPWKMGLPPGLSYDCVVSALLGPSPSRIRHDITDAQLAAVTIEQGAELQATNRDFTRFPDLRWKNPLT